MLQMLTCAIKTEKQVLSSEMKTFLLMPDKTLKKNSKCKKKNIQTVSFTHYQRFQNVSESSQNLQGHVCKEVISDTLICFLLRTMSQQRLLILTSFCLEKGNIYCPR